MSFAKSLLALGMLVLGAHAAVASTQQSFKINYNVHLLQPFQSPKKPILPSMKRYHKLTTPTPQYDTIMTDPATALHEIREYNLLYFQNINTINLTLATVGITPHTAPNFAVYTSNTQLVDMDGADYRITSKYTESTISYFDAISWYYVCAVATEEIVAIIPTDCTITATGYNTSGKKVATQTFTYTADPLVARQPMNYGKFSSKFKSLEYMVLTVSDNTTVAAGIDDFVATVYQTVS